MTNTTFRVIAYVTSSVVPETIPYDRLTHINYAFLIPNADGSLATFPNGWKLKNIVAQAHQAGVQVLISVGGWGWDEQFETLAADPAGRAHFVQNLGAFAAEYGLDGADIDWEYPDPGQSAQNFLALMTELRAALPGKLLTAAVVSYGKTGSGVPDASFPLLDFINVMTYDGPDHATMAQFEAGLAYWQGRGLPPEKLVMGLPFYARPGEILYRKIVAADPQAAYTNTIDWQGAPIVYNGIPTIQTKTRLAGAHRDPGGLVTFLPRRTDLLQRLRLILWRRPARPGPALESDPPWRTLSTLAPNPMRMRWRCAQRRLPLRRPLRPAHRAHCHLLRRGRHRIRPGLLQTR